MYVRDMRENIGERRKRKLKKIFKKNIASIERLFERSTRNYKNYIKNYLSASHFVLREKLFYSEKEEDILIKVINVLKRLEFYIIILMYASIFTLKKTKGF